MTSQPFFSCMAQIQIHPYEPFSPIFNPFASQNPRGREREREREREHFLGGFDPQILVMWVTQDRIRSGC